jgi:hypothetical protein
VRENVEQLSVHGTAAWQAAGELTPLGESETFGEVSEKEGQKEWAPDWHQ